MIEETKIIEFKLPEILKNNKRCNFGLDESVMELRNKITSIIDNEFTNYFSKERVNKYDGTKVARTSYLSLNFSAKGFKDSQEVFELYEMENQGNGNCNSSHTKGKILERMTLIIKFI